MKTYQRTIHVVRRYYHPLPQILKSYGYRRVSLTLIMEVNDSAVLDGTGGATKTKTVPSVDFLRGIGGDTIGKGRNSSAFQYMTLFIDHYKGYILVCVNKFQ